MKPSVTLGSKVMLRVVRGRPAAPCGGVGVAGEGGRRARRRLGLAGARTSGLLVAEPARPRPAVGFVFR